MVNARSTTSQIIEQRFLCTESATQIDNRGAYVSAANLSAGKRNIRKDGGRRKGGGVADIGGRGEQARTRRPERRRRPHRVKWKPMYARLSSRVNPDHSSIVPQTGDPRPFPGPSAPATMAPPFSRPLSNSGKPVSWGRERVHLCTCD